MVGPIDLPESLFDRLMIFLLHLVKNVSHLMRPTALYRDRGVVVRENREESFPTVY